MTNSTDSLLVNLAFLSKKPTGLTVYAQNICPYLAHLNPTCLASHPIPDLHCYKIAENLNSDYGAKGHLRRLIWTQFKLAGIHRQLGASLLFSPIPEAPLFSSCRYIVTVHDLIPLRFGKPFSRLTTYFRYYIPQVLHQAEHIICNSESTRQEVMAYFGIPGSKITAILLAYDRSHFRHLNLSTGNYFLYIGRHDRHKNLDRLISAFATLSHHQDCELYLAGSYDPRYTPALKTQIEELEISHRVKFLDYIPYADLPVLINQSIALVFPSLWEGFGLPVLEAMACGTPVITSNLSALPEVAGDAAISIDPYNVGAIADAMQALLDSSALRSQMRVSGLARAELFSWELTGRSTAAILSKYV
ncbi:glycosyltransferase family 4 protein [Pseudanabaena sp. PCC 6802]|uniref:glycosyltransferase family 4 protein n=1 Tax=Pseudanabaena sp. PCC 6802 TaxID=118173 RepID=UPI0003495191|nr:glycosyltransferase family 1 protein [Pseudanabaena sp. PCC 6802]